MGSGSGGDHRAGRAKLPVVPLLLHVIGALIAAAAWVALVLVAIDFGRDARVDGGLPWLWVALCSLAAIGSLVLAVTLVGRALVLAGVVSTYRPKRARR